jgi:hypothetical protein
MRGRVVHVRGADSTAVAGEWAVLHRVGLASGEPIDSVPTDRRGRYRVSAPERDTLATYLVSVRYLGIAYFTEALSGVMELPDSFRTLAVYDTSSTAPVELLERHVIIRPPASDGTRRMVELVVLVNHGHQTRIAADTARPVWQLELPAGATGLEFGAGDVSEMALSFEDGRLQLAAPLPPGERQLLVGYLIPSSVRDLTIPVDQPVTRFHVLLEDSAAVAEGAVSPRGWEDLEGIAFRRYTGDSLPAGASVVVRFPEPAGARTDLALWLIVPAVALVLGVTLVRWLRRTPANQHAPGDPGSLAAEIAALDAQYAGREDQTYRRRRAELKARLTVALDREEGRG